MKNKTKSKKIFNKIKKYKWLIFSILVFFSVRWFYTRDGVKTLSVKYIEPQEVQIEKTVSTNGIVKSQTSANLSFSLSGKVNKILVKEGQNVEKGELLVTLDSSVAYQNVKSYKDARDVAIRNKEIFIEQYDKNRERLGGEEDYKINLRKYDELISQAEANYNAQLNSIANYNMYSPVKGVVVDITKEIGESVTLNEKVISINDLDNIVFEAEVDQEDFGFLAVGQTAVIELDAFSDSLFIGIVKKLPLFIKDATNGRFVIELDILNESNQKPLVGMTGDSKITVSKTLQKVKALFYDQIFYDQDNNPFVYTEKNGFIKKQPLKIGLEGDVYTEVNIDFEEKIISGVNKDVELSEGFKVKVVDL